jgi:hypothetical protein
MLNLSPEAEGLVRAAKEAYRPSDADRGRVLDALRERLGEAVVLSDGALHSAMGSRGFWSRASGLTVVGLAVVVAVLWLALRTEPASSMALPGVVSSVVGPAALSSPAAAAASVPPEPVRESVAPPARHSDPARPALARRVRDGLSEEVAILSRAETDLHGNRPELALLALDEHERRFGHGVLEEERMAARVQALCALGRTAEADAELARLARMSPNSPHTERSRQVCRMKQSR